MLVSGSLPEDPDYEALKANHFRDYRLEVYGKVAYPLSLSMWQLAVMPKQEQITLHNCIQGWSGIAKWKGVPFTAILDRCEPLPEARYAILPQFGIRGTLREAVRLVKPPSPHHGGPWHESTRIVLQCR